MLYSPPGCLRDGGSFPLRRSSSGSHSVGVEEHLRSKASRLVRTTFTELMSFNDWAWPICLMKLVSLPRPSPIKKNSIQISVVFYAWVNVSKILGGISPCYIFSYLSNWMNLLVKSPVSVLFQSTSSEEKVSPSCPLPMDFVVKVPSTHSSIVLNSLLSSVEDLSCLAYICVVVYAYCLRGWIISSFYCSEEV
ncbi:hypothetical protein F2Q69_00054896 [Brassica cretica]|uniref:Uncharacterized protein n=1 Tax=Brassica cretica TaxID=69181 RepID=A0A8S9N0D2_BRACR|nr:hypothetical protein F2Q69_00054896 [Brassica cretica]